MEVRLPVVRSERGGMAGGGRGDAGGDPAWTPGGRSAPSAIACRNARRSAMFAPCPLYMWSRDFSPGGRHDRPQLAVPRGTVGLPEEPRRLTIPHDVLRAFIPPHRAAHAHGHIGEVARHRGPVRACEIGDGLGPRPDALDEIAYVRHELIAHLFVPLVGDRLGPVGELGARFGG